MNPSVFLAIPLGSCFRHARSHPPARPFPHDLEQQRCRLRRSRGGPTPDQPCAAVQLEEIEKGVEVTWNRFFAKQPPEKARKLIETFANVDACLTGQARQIRFFSGGQLVGKASPDTGIVVADYLCEPASRAAPSKAPALTVRGKPIRVGMTSDDVVAILKNSEMVEQEVKADPALAGSLLVTKQYKADGKSFTLVMARSTTPGPYLEHSIIPAPK